jgi:hypothetical protein
MCWKILDEDELPCRRRRVGESFLIEVSVMEIRPWGVSSVKEGILGGGRVVGWVREECHQIVYIFQ